MGNPQAVHFLQSRFYHCWQCLGSLIDLSDECNDAECNDTESTSHISTSALNVSSLIQSTFLLLSGLYNSKTVGIHCFRFGSKCWKSFILCGANKGFERTKPLLFQLVRNAFQHLLGYRIAFSQKRFTGQSLMSADLNDSFGMSCTAAQESDDSLDEYQDESLPNSISKSEGESITTSFAVPQRPPPPVSKSNTALLVW